MAALMTKFRERLESRKRENIDKVRAKLRTGGALDDSLVQAHEESGRSVSDMQRDAEIIEECRRCDAAAKNVKTARDAFLKARKACDAHDVNMILDEARKRKATLERELQAAEAVFNNAENARQQAEALRVEYAEILDAAPVDLDLFTLISGGSVIGVSDDDSPTLSVSGDIFTEQTARRSKLLRQAQDRARTAWNDRHHEWRKEMDKQGVRLPLEAEQAAKLGAPKPLTLPTWADVVAAKAS